MILKQASPTPTPQEIIANLKLTTYGKFSTLETDTFLAGYSYNECIGVVFHPNLTDAPSNWLYPVELSTLATQMHMERFKAIVWHKLGVEL